MPNVNWFRRRLKARAAALMTTTAGGGARARLDATEQRMENAPTIMARPHGRDGLQQAKRRRPHREERDGHRIEQLISAVISSMCYAVS